MNTEVRIDGQSIDLGENVRIPIDLVNPHLTYDLIPDSKSSVPNAPFSLRNQRIFRYAEMPQSGNELRRYVCEQMYNGAMIYKGLAYVKSASPISGYSLEVSDDLNRFFGQHQNTLLTEMDLGTIPLDPLSPVVTVGDRQALCFPTILNPDYYGTNGGAISYRGIVNEYDGTDHKTDAPIVPMLFVNYLLDKIADHTGITIGGSYLLHPTWKQLVLTNWRALDGDTAVKINRHVPAWTIPSFIIELRKIPNLEYKFNAVEKHLEINFWEEKFLLGPVADWTSKAVVGHEKFPEFNRRLHLTFDLDSSDSLMKDKPEIMADYVTPSEAVLGNIAVGLAKVSLRLNTFLTDEVTGLPVAKQAGITVQFNQLAVNAAPRLLFWRGIVEGMPTALPELDGKSLYITGETGIGETSWNRIEEMRLGMFYLKKSFNLTETDLALLDFSRTIHYNGMNYLIAHISGELPLTKECACLLVKV